jgi:hypothetical protein
MAKTKAVRPCATTYTLTLTRAEFKLLMDCVHERNFQVHPCDRNPEVWSTLTDKMLDAIPPPVHTCSAEDHTLASCEALPGHPLRESAPKADPA